MANMIELVHPSAHSSPQPKRQTYRFSRFTQLTTECLYFTMGAPIHQNCPFHLDSHLTHDALGPCEPTTQTAPRWVQPCLHRWPQSVIYFTIVRLFPAQNCPFNPPESWTQTATP